MLQKNFRRYMDCRVKPGNDEYLAPMTDYLDINRRNWDERAAIHARDAAGDYMLDRFRAGEDALHAIEAAELGDISGKRVLHLQCHIGRDTLCLVRRGAAVWHCRCRDRKSTRLNSSHMSISYAVFCLKKKNTHDTSSAPRTMPHPYVSARERKIIARVPLSLPTRRPPSSCSLAARRFRHAFGVPQALR